MCATIKAVQYVYKYVYKGADRTIVELIETNKIKQYVNTRYIGSSEAVWRIFEYFTHQEHPPVQKLQVHLPGAHVVYYPPDLTAEELAAKMEASGSTLTAWFEYNRTHDDGLHLLYPEFPSEFRYVAKSKKWQKRKNSSIAIGRIYYYSPVASEKFYLRLLLTVLPG